MDSKSSDSNSADDRVWERGWDEHQRLQARRLAKLPLSEKLAWLEEAHRLVIQLKTGRRSHSKANA